MNDLEKTKKEYPVGSRIILWNMADDPSPQPPMSFATVTHVDDQAQVHVIFDDGRAIGLIPGIDRFSNISSDKELSIDDYQTNNLIKEKSLSDKKIAVKWKGTWIKNIPESLAEEIFKSMQHIFLREDAVRYIEEELLGYTDTKPTENQERWIRENFGMSYDRLLYETSEHCAYRFVDLQSCGTPDDVTWKEIVERELRFAKNYHEVVTKKERGGKLYA